MLLEEAVGLWKEYADLSEVFKGWVHQRTPLAFYTEEMAVLFAHPNPPTEFRAIEFGGVSFHVAKPKPKHFTANTSMDVGGIQTATMRWFEGTQVERLALAVHEAFHSYQHEVGIPFANIMLMTRYPAYDPVINALAEVEALLLEAAIDACGVLDVVYSLLDAHSARQALLEPDLLAWENQNELSEGLSTYTEMVVSQRDSIVWDANISKLRRINRKGFGVERQRFYFSGMAYGLILDQLVPSWQEEVTRGKNSLQGLLAEYLGYTPRPERREFGPVDFSDILARQQRECLERAEEQHRRVDEALPGKGMRVDISFSGTVQSGGWNPYTISVLPNGQRFHTTMLMYNYDTGTELRVESGALEPEMTVQVIFERPDLIVTLNGTPLPSGSHTGELVIEGADVRLYMPRATVDLDGSSLRVIESNQVSASA